MSSRFDTNANTSKMPVITRSQHKAYLSGEEHATRVIDAEFESELGYYYMCAVDFNFTVTDDYLNFTSKFANFTTNLRRILGRIQELQIRQSPLWKRTDDASIRKLRVLHFHVYRQSAELMKSVTMNMPKIMETVTTGKFDTNTVSVDKLHKLIQTIRGKIVQWRLEIVESTFRPKTFAELESRRYLCNALDGADEVTSGLLEMLPKKRSSRNPNPKYRF